MIKQLTLSQLHMHIKYNMSTHIVKNIHDNKIQLVYTIKITNIPIYTVFDLYNILHSIAYEWNDIARNNIMDEFETYINVDIPDDNYELLCERLRLPESVKKDNCMFDMTYLTGSDFKPCTLEECNLTDNYIKLSDDELFNLCHIPLTDKQKAELAAL